MTISLVEPNALIALARTVEAYCPGWWWSFSQKKDNATLSLGPGPNSPHPGDVVLLGTHEGDAGFIFDYPGYRLGIHSLTYLDQFVDHRIDSLLEKRGFEPGKDGRAQMIMVAPTSAHRRQSFSDFQQLAKIYSVFCHEVPFWEKQSGYEIEELYLGSCDLSVDCSIRGKRPDESTFDVSVDLLNDATISEALGWAVSEFKSDILTPR